METIEEMKDRHMDALTGLIEELMKERQRKGAAKKADEVRNQIEDYRNELLEEYRSESC